MGILKVKTIWFVLYVVVGITQKNCYSKAFGWLSSCWPQDNLGPHIFSYFIWKNRFVVPRLFRILKLKYAEKTSKIKTRTNGKVPWKLPFTIGFTITIFIFISILDCEPKIPDTVMLCQCYTPSKEKRRFLYFNHHSKEFLEKMIPHLKALI